MRKYDDDYDVRDDDDDDIRKVPRVAYPRIVGLAAIAWIVFGCLILLSVSVSVAIQLTQGAAAGSAQTAGAVGGSVCAVGIILLFGIGFIFVGVQTVRGTAADTLGNGIAS